MRNFSPRYFGPYKIVQHIGPIAYKLELPSSASIHSVFHVSQLKHALGDGISSQPLSPMLDAELEWLVEPELVLGVRSRSGLSDREVLIKWKDLPDFEASWEPEDMIAKQFPDFPLEDKVTLVPGGIDKPPIRYTYARRNKRSKPGDIVQAATNQSASCAIGELMGVH